jgi:hypothetical protein
MSDIILFLLYSRIGLDDDIGREMLTRQSPLDSGRQLDLFRETDIVGDTYQEIPIAILLLRLRSTAPEKNDPSSFKAARCQLVPDGGHDKGEGSFVSRCIHDASAI